VAAKRGRIIGYWWGALVFVFTAAKGPKYAISTSLKNKGEKKGRSAVRGNMSTGPEHQRD